MTDIHDRIRGRETDLLRAVGIEPPERGGHVTCPFPGHADRHPSWRWDARKRRFYCSCTPGGGTVIDAVMRMKGLEFRDATTFSLTELGIWGEKGAKTSEEVAD